MLPRPSVPIPLLIVLGAVVVAFGTHVSAVLAAPSPEEVQVGDPEEYFSVPQSAPQGAPQEVIDGATGHLQEGTAAQEVLSSPAPYFRCGNESVEDAVASYLQWLAMWSTPSLP